MVGNIVSSETASLLKEIWLSEKDISIESFLKLIPLQVWKTKDNICLELTLDTINKEKVYWTVYYKAALLSSFKKFQVEGETLLEALAQEVIYLHQNGVDLNWSAISETE